MSNAIERTETAASGETLIDVQDLKKYYGGNGFFAPPPVKAVDTVNFEIKRGETFGLVGESGSGKSTLGRTLVRLEQATDGSVSFDGTDITELSGSDLKKWRSNAQMVFQDPESSLNDRMTVGEIIREPLDAHGWKTKSERRERVTELLSEVGLREEHYFRYPHQFSGGQRQRIGIARALALEPEFVVLDEPVSALDVSVQAKIITLLEDLQEEFDLTYLFIAHDLSVVRHICDRVAVMYLGKIMEIGDTEELYENPQNPYTQALLSAIPRPDPTITIDRITLPGTPPSPRDPPQGCQFSTRCPAKIRPEAYADVPDETWDAVEQLREVIRERSRMSLSATDQMRKRLGRFSRFDDIDGTVEDLFEELPVPQAVEDHVQHAVGLVKDGEPEEARTYLRDEFGGVCDTTRPDHHQVSASGRESYCHRHDTEYDDVTAVLSKYSDGA
ncbi:ABC transporter ATP-binding protein [Halosegnis longus]|uniref:ABC transporter ATP-binding protein n=1 Tax=Halosegnis longus TaxID=2216012 RepID=A0AAJ4R6Q8_9EURY|nr:MULTISPECIES: ABC transporter ATP-binding protein [Halobacteriales]RNJ25317.1 ABC transporter ATP-binding protein [Salella cibi]